MKHFSKVILSAVAVTAMSACVSPQPEGEVSALSVATVQASLPATPQLVRWGGTIASIENTSAGKTVLEVVARPLNLTGRPLRNDRTDGRFIAELDSFLDPEIVKIGRDITVLGEVASRRTGVVGKTEYTFPVVAVEQYRYWKLVQKSNPAHLPYPSVHDRFHNDFWHDWPHAHERRSPKRTATAKIANGAAGILDE